VLDISLAVVVFVFEATVVVVAIIKFEVFSTFSEILGTCSIVISTGTSLVLSFSGSVIRQSVSHCSLD